MPVIDGHAFPISFDDYSSLSVVDGAWFIMCLKRGEDSEAHRYLKRWVEQHAVEDER